MIIFNTELLRRFSARFWDEEDDDAIVSELISIEVDREDEYVKYRFYVYRQGFEEDYRNITAYAYSDCDYDYIIDFVFNTGEKIERIYYIASEDVFVTAEQFINYYN